MKSGKPVGDSLDQTFDPSSLGLDGVFQKPIDPKQLLSTLRARLQAGGPA
jgi:hypothetical protein